MKHNFRHLEIWKRSRMLTKEIYMLVASLPKDERFGISSQMKRAAISVAANIAEGSGRGSNRDMSRFLDMSIGSLCEIETLCYLCEDLDLIEKNSIEEVILEIEEVRRMTIGF